MVYFDCKGICNAIPVRRKEIYMEESKKLSSEEVKEVSGGEEVDMAMKCPQCGTWNSAGSYTPAGPNDRGISVVVTFTCDNCGCNYSGSFTCKV